MAHLRIGRLLASRTAPDEREEKIFDIVNQLDRGAALITAPKEREQVAELNLIAGKRAKSATAYVGSLAIFLRRPRPARGERLGVEVPIGVRPRAQLGRVRIFDGSIGVGRRTAVGPVRAANLVDTAAVACVRLNTLYHVGPERQRRGSRPRLSPAGWRRQWPASDSGRRPAGI